MPLSLATPPLTAAGALIQTHLGGGEGQPPTLQTLILTHLGGRDPPSRGEGPEGVRPLIQTHLGRVRVNQARTPSVRPLFLMSI